MGAEVTIGAGEDTICADCFCPLPAGAPAWPGESGQPLCADCTVIAGEASGALGVPRQQ
jgi:hypothetical protein